MIEFWMDVNKAGMQMRITSLDLKRAVKIGDCPSENWGQSHCCPVVEF